MQRTTKAIAVAASVMLGVASCGGDGGGGAEGTGSGDDPIVVGVLADLSGATADVGTPYSDGIRGYVAALNADGGIEGREIDLRVNDYAYDVARAEQLYSQYLNEGAVAIQGWGTGDTEALRQRVAQDELPFMSASYAATLVDPQETPYNFVVAASYSDQMRAALDWIAEDSGGSAEVAVFHHDSPFGTSPVADGEAHVETEGLDLGYQSYAMPAGATDFIGLLTQAQEQGARYIVIQNVSSPASVVARNIAQQNLDMQIVCLNWCADELFIELAGDAAEGTVMVQPFTPPSVEVPGHEAPAAYLESEGMSLDERGLHYVQGWYTMHVMAEGIGEVVASGEAVTGPAIRTALEEMGPVETGGVTPPVEFSAESHLGTDETGIYRAEGGEMVEISQPGAP